MHLLHKPQISRDTQPRSQGLISFSQHKNEIIVKFSMEFIPFNLQNMSYSGESRRSSLGGGRDVHPLNPSPTSALERVTWGLLVDDTLLSSKTL